jgi:hypothetical protein
MAFAVSPQGQKLDFSRMNLIQCLFFGKRYNHENSWVEPR